MEKSPRGTESKDFSLNQPEQNSNMSMIAMATPSPHPSFRRSYWDEARSTEYAPSRARPEAERIALPSIRQMIPNYSELQLRIAPPQAQDGPARTSSSVSAPSPAAPAQRVATPEYVHSPSSNKRRRLSIDDQREERASRVPRLYNSPPRATERPMSHTMSPEYAPRTAPEQQWGPALRTSPQLPQGGLPAMRSPVQEPRPSLPSFPPPMSMERGPAPPMPRMRGHSSDDYHLQEGPRPVYMHPADPRFEPAGPYRQPPHYGYSYHHPSRIQSLSLSSIPHPLDRSPFSAGGYGPSHYGEYTRFGEMAMSVGADNKQRKRRGNLPKETTDKLRAWFVGHLHHPYPTEDEKQELMRQTGLQMNQISNWFINARRRQLPTLIGNAQAEQNAMSGKALPASERGEYDEAKSRNSPTTSDGGDSAFDEELDLHRRPQHLKRGGSY